MHIARGASKDFAFITGLRALAALFVMTSHVWYQIWPAVNPPYGYGRHPDGLVATLTEWLYYGHFGVVVFIVLSGFCLMLPVAANEFTPRGGWSGFLRRRARRILPPYYAALLLALGLIALCIDEMTGSQWDISLPVTAAGVASHVLLVQDFVHSTQINYVFWSIATEAHLYLMFPAIVWAMRRFGATSAAAGLCVAIYGLIAVLEFYEYQAVPPQFIGLVADFVLGMWSATLLLRWRGASQLRWGRLCLAFAVPLLVCCALWGPEVAERRFAFLDALCALATASLLLGAAREDSTRRFEWLELPWLVRIGTFSYSIYLVHAPMLHLVWRFVIDPWRLSPARQFLALLALGVPLSLLAAYVFFLLFEKPFLMPQSDRGAARTAALNSMPPVGTPQS